ncbi:hypothetical protein NW762_002600 [Fusarium torreyae]|uniref:Uncharacterized protein n=1 Tax=Fusarium torreyae TaxID=1237075 RepID=A0A9W8VK98_9HYPO|nr:hypothetical protein NW762_002600 [Fusarium torreyae]
MATMLNTNSLQPPKTGTSRWSKALPDVPGPDDPSFYDDYYEDDSPRLPPAKELPPPPPRSTSIVNAKPLPPSLPPLHLLAADNPPSGPPKMAIPRRPIGKLPANPPPPPQKHQQQSFASQGPPSPSESLSSILSAYSHSSGESLVRSPDEANSSARESEANPSLSQQAPLPISSTKTGTFVSASTEQQQQQHVAPKLPVNDHQPPPLPSKDTKYHLPASPAPNRKPAPENKLPELNSSSPQTQQQQPQLWRRRSSKAKRSLELPDLKLISSHGSTAATQPTGAAVAPRQVQPQLPSSLPKISTTPNWQPGSTNPTAPAGQDLRQMLASEQLAETLTMGSNSSKLDRLKDKLHLHRRGKSSSDTSKASTPRPGAHRPPTPEYQKEDIKTPIVDSFVSPLSPASSPEPVAQVSPELLNEIPQTSLQQRTRAPSTGAASITRKAIPTPKLTSPVEDEPISEPPNLKIETPLTGSLPSSSVSRGSRGSASGDSTAYRAQPSAEVPNRFPPRHSSVRSNAPPRQLVAEQDPRLVASESQGFLYRGRDGTLYPEMKVLREPDPRAAYFPKQSDTPIPEGTIIRAPPLKESHFTCYHGHRTMNRRTNKYYPLTCQACDKSDIEDRWTCSFCHLRICEPCLKKLNNIGNDLRRLTDQLEQTS